MFSTRAGKDEGIPFRREVKASIFLYQVKCQLSIWHEEQAGHPQTANVVRNEWLTSPHREAANQEKVCAVRAKECKCTSNEDRYELLSRCRYVYHRVRPRTDVQDSQHSQARLSNRCHGEPGGGPFVQVRNEAAERARYVIYFWPICQTAANALSKPNKRPIVIRGVWPNEVAGNECCLRANEVHCPSFPWEEFYLTNDQCQGRQGYVIQRKVHFEWVIQRVWQSTSRYQ